MLVVGMERLTAAEGIEHAGVYRRTVATRHDYTTVDGARARELSGLRLAVARRDLFASRASPGENERTGDDEARPHTASVAALSCWATREQVA